MKLIRNLLIGVALLLAPMLSQALDRVYVVPVQLNAAGATETNVTVSTGVGGAVAQIVLAANASRLDFDIELATCSATTSKVYYAYDAGGFTLGAPGATPANWVNFASADPNTRKFRKPDWIMPVGAIYAITDGAASSCFLTVREWVSTSPIFQ